MNKNLSVRKRNPLKRFDEMVKLNPYAAVAKRAELIAQQAGGFKDKKRKAPAGGAKEIRANKKAFYQSMVEEPEVVEGQKLWKRRRLQKQLPLPRLTWTTIKCQFHLAY